SAVSKVLDIHELVSDKELDVLCLTETWLREKGDEVSAAEMTPSGYSFHSTPRLSGRGGGIAIIYKSHLNVKDIRDSSLIQHPPSDANMLADLYNETLAHILDKHAPITTKHVPAHSSTAWYNPEIQKAKCRKRRAERKWRKSRLEIDRQLYKQARNELTKLISQQRYCISRKNSSWHHLILAKCSLL
ncbi:hypothetical protein BaRGS_00026801, partial [Batillaria attramentaria]